MKNSLIPFSRLAGMALFFAAAFFLTTVVHAATLVVPTKIPYHPDSGATEAVKNECKLEEKLITFITSFGEASGFEKVTADAAGATDPKILNLEIINVLGAGGGAWSGGKAVTVKGTLKDKGKTYNFRARRMSGGGAFAGYKGTCSILGRCTKTLGKDIANWAKAPTDNANLGDL